MYAECGQNKFDLVNNALARERNRHSILSASQGIDNAGDEIDSDDDEEIGTYVFYSTISYIHSVCLIFICVILQNYLQQNCP